MRARAHKQSFITLLIMLCKKKLIVWYIVFKKIIKMNNLKIENRDECVERREGITLSVINEDY